MKTKLTKYFTLIALVLIILVGIFLFTQPSLEEIKNQIAENNSYFVETPLKMEYDSLCKVEDEKNIYFPGKDVKYAKLTKNDFWKKSEIIKGKGLAKLLKFLNDSTSYRWGELGTPEIHYYLTYFDQEDNCIGLTTIDLEGMAYSYPMIARMKWGMLKDMDLIDKLITE
ncbi:hypothetical protein JMN32_08685 [Fulvivirga sp. 29W222]|uniref:DUF4830 domain-containing protein n=1 Tax=Fulvivirga marina TaxID=2494733 RepID=A0A937G0R6_9BACT|nr:hypothetical protein [Fulvivirga marina]MBL6446381.1 hypothetical protein [Fulvivirga marina]